MTETQIKEDELLATIRRLRSDTDVDIRQAWEIVKGMRSLGFAMMLDEHNSDGAPWCPETPSHWACIFYPIGVESFSRDWTRWGWEPITAILKSAENALERKHPLRHPNIRVTFRAEPPK